MNGFQKNKSNYNRSFSHHFAKQFFEKFNDISPLVDFMSVHYWEWCHFNNEPASFSMKIYILWDMKALKRILASEYNSFRIALWLDIQRQILKRYNGAPKEAFPPSFGAFFHWLSLTSTRGKRMFHAQSFSIYFIFRWLLNEVWGSREHHVFLPLYAL